MDSDVQERQNKNDKKSKKKKYSKKSRGSTSNDSDSVEELWVESTSTETTTAKTTKVLKTRTSLQRDDWMNIDAVIPTITRKQMRDKKKKDNFSVEKSLSTVDKPGQHSRELNPYWKDGGKGLPSELSDKKQPLPSVGDGGLNWLRKAYKRVHEQAEEEGKSVEEIASQRWGSLENLESLIAEAEGKSGSGYRRHERQNRNYNYEERRGRYENRKGSDYRTSDDVRNNRDRRDHPRSKGFRKPGEEHNQTSGRSSSKHYEKQQPRWMKKSEKEKPENKSNEGETKTHLKAVMKLETRETEKPTTSQETEKHKVDKPTIKALSEKEMNVLGAKILKAELMGNTELMAKLKVQMDNALLAKEMGVKADEDISVGKKQVVVLTQSNAKGMSRPLQEPEAGTSDKRKTKVATHDRDGKRIRYFHDDEKYSLKEMFEREKFTTADDETAMYLKMAAKNRPKTDEDYDIDDVFVDKAARGTSSAKDNERARSQAIKEHKSSSFAMENCYQCLDSRNSQKHLIIAFGQKAYLSLPYHESLNDGHCFIIPMNHVPSATLLDEDVWSEIQQFRKTIALMFQDRGQDTVFMETSMNLRRHPHMYIECVPLDQEVGMVAPMYFKKAILESETEWAQNIKLVDISKKDIRHSVPKGLPYFSVDFGLQGGFAHVIEDEKEFPTYFGKEIVGGMLDAEPRLWLKPPKQKFEDQRKKVLQFTEWWKPYDWTTKIQTGDSDTD